MDDQLKHHISMMFYGMSDLGECLEVARTIRLHDEESWVSSWSAMARTLQGRAEDSERNGHRISAGDQYLRASTYWRASLMHFTEPEDPRTREYALTSYACYDKYLELSGYPGERLEIPYEDSFLPAYLYRSPHATGPAPLIIFHQGRDAWPEDTRWVYDNAIRRGYHCLAVQGPGQGMALRVNNLPFRYDWENVITPVVDFALELDGIDPERLALMGLSFGGYLAPRAAVFEKRIKLLIADPGVLDWGGSIRQNLGAELSAAFDQGPEAYNAASARAQEVSPLHAWGIRDFLWKHGVDNPYDLTVELDKCDLTGIADQIECPTLIMDGVTELFSVGEGQKLFEALTCEKEYLVLDESTTAQLHCQNGANATAAESLYAWIDGRL
ncbi:alpha/beta hydrolase [Nocardioides marmoriginsengisoli]|uniref:Alpha/beta hydrolase n=2 Tax=Nocardioides marmoriginsengisoli TaxID=661483 RepID=A0A3N0CGD9_9ACTN|nr:alpha/beta hydrolase [Nocardioides marmoriginsengisoli]